MRYCPYCHRFSPGQPPICHFSGRTWYTRLCPRGHENPVDSRYCGTCGSTDLSTTAGRAPWLMLTMKAMAWLFLGLFIYSLADGVYGYIKSCRGVCVVSHFIVLILVFLGLSFLFSHLPASWRQTARMLGRYTLKGLWLIVCGLLKLIWKILR
jgi:hypothetical protein